MKKIKKLYLVNVYNNILLHGFGWYQTNVRVYAHSLKECIDIVNRLFPFESSLLISNTSNKSLYVVSVSRKSFVKY